MVGLVDIDVVGPAGGTPTSLDLGFEAIQTVARPLNGFQFMFWDVTTRLDAGLLFPVPGFGVQIDPGYTGPALNQFDLSMVVNGANVGGGARKAPKMLFLKNFVVVGAQSTGYIRNASGHGEAGWSFSWQDPAPAPGDTYGALFIPEAAGGTVNTTPGECRFTGALSRA